MDDLKNSHKPILQGISGAQAGPGVAGVSDANNRAFASRGRSVLVDKGAGVGTIAGVVADDEENKRKAAQQKKLSELRDMVDPSKYERRRKR